MQNSDEKRVYIVKSVSDYNLVLLRLSTGEILEFNIFYKNMYRFASHQDHRCQNVQDRLDLPCCRSKALQMVIQRCYRDGRCYLFILIHSLKQIPYFRGLY